MFDPLFSVAFLGAIFVPIAAIVFLAVRNRLPLRSALLMAFVVPFAGLIGFFGSAAILINFTTLFWIETPPMIRVGICFVGAMLLACLMGWLVWSRRSRTLHPPN